MMFSILPKISMLVFLLLACQYDNSLSTCRADSKKEKTIQLKTSKQLLEQIDKELESIFNSKLNLSINNEPTPEDQSNVETVHKESLSKDVEKEISLEGGQNLSSSVDNEILEKTENKEILKSPKHEEGIKENQDIFNPLKQKIANFQMINVADYTKKFGETFEKIKSMKDKALSGGMTSVMEYQKRIDEALEKINMMKENFMKQKVKDEEALKLVDYKKKIDDVFEKINMIKENLMKPKIKDEEVPKVVDDQKALKENSGFIKTEQNAVLPPSLDSMKPIKAKKIVIPNPIGMLDSQIEKILFNTYSYVDACEDNPDISANQLRLVKLKKYGIIISLPFVFALCGAVFFAEESLHFLTVIFFSLGIIISLYNLVKVLKYDIKAHGIHKPVFMDYLKSFKRCIT
ncbi:Pv-fam-b protein [Plasmodium cynomolgi strain B]|uniref:Pv-fam-b protein n=1 Tax=Plasmodium cynomolgi (strain B) TaxID=1120755 RepID=K6UCI3_PLACD|nr:Pv-fam-b protein [Plasmodium cynomolgi strain B]GAB64901.1 Pv-fam-b protein [Plasmodium cynomolgi strain B]